VSPTAGAPARIVTVRRARQSGPRVALDHGLRRAFLGPQGRIAAAANHLLVALDVVRREIVAAHHVGEELHDALQLLGDHAVDAHAEQRLHLGDVSRAHDDPHGRVHQARDRCDAMGHRRVVVGDHQHLGAIGPGSEKRVLAAGVASQHGEPVGFRLVSHLPGSAW